MAILTEVDGRLQLDFADAEAAVLGDLLDRVASLLSETDDNPVLARLLPDAHRDDHEVAVAHRELTEASLRQDKRADIDAVRAALPAGEGKAELVDPDAWLRALNDVRLMLGVQLGITEDAEPPRRVRDQRDLQLSVYFWLTAVQDCLVEAVLSAG